eukprot:scaffold117495_cov10-Tisochrysis_lutea.AAC.1
MPFVGGILLRPNCSSECGKPPGNIVSYLGLLQGPLVQIWSHAKVHKSREVRSGPKRPPLCP